MLAKFCLAELCHTQKNEKQKPKNEKQKIKNEKQKMKNKKWKTKIEKQKIKIEKWKTKNKNQNQKKKNKKWKTINKKGTMTLPPPKEKSLGSVPYIGYCIFPEPGLVRVSRLVCKHPHFYCRKGFWIKNWGL